MTVALSKRFFSPTCSGTKNSYSESGRQDKLDAYHYFQKIYENCSVVYQNVEITNYSDEREIDFLDDIVEVKGYILIYNNNRLKRISMRNLEIVWGESLHRPGINDMAIEIVHNPMLEQVNMPNLRGVINGNVGIGQNRDFCYANSIHWEEILEPTTKKNGSSRAQLSENGGKACAKEKLACHPSCESGCYGPEAANCQQVVRSKCTKACQKNANACYLERDQITNATSYECCDAECAAGCHGPTSRDCYGCKNYRDEDTKRCVEHCAPLYRLDPLSTTRTRNPLGRFTHAKSCLQECPVGTLIEGAYCVLRCSEGHFHDARLGTRECKPCQGTCPKSCRLEEEINSENIEQLQNCTEIDGFIKLQPHLFSDHYIDAKSKRMRKGLRLEKLDYLKTVRQITQYVEVVGLGSLSSLGFLESVEVIEGRKLASEKYALLVSGNLNLRSVDMKNLHQIRRGEVLVKDNSLLCFLENRTFTGITDRNSSTRVQGLWDACVGRQLVCDVNCDPAFGCWGAGAAMCRKCLQWSQEGRCVQKCSTIGYREVHRPSKKGFQEQVCEKCSDQCLQCNGPGEGDCLECRNVRLVKDGKLKCLAECPIGYYRLGNECLKCHQSCYDNGCTGSSDIIGAQGCNNCSIYVEIGDATHHQYKCLYVDRAEHHDSQACELNGFEKYFAYPEGSRIQCKRCAPECKRCKTGGTSVQESRCECLHMSIPVEPGSNDRECVTDCGTRGFPIEVDIGERNVTQCELCHSFCEGGCRGPTNLDCNKCKNATILHSNGTRTCLSECDSEHPHYEKHSKFCRTKEWVLWRKAIIVIVIGAIILALIGVFFVCWKCRYYKNKYTEEKIVNGPDLPEEIPFDPMARPNMNHFNVITADELTKQGKVLGEGAFGIVYAGYYRKCNRKFPVAIKVIKSVKGMTSHENSTEQSEMMDEATKMASLRHAHLIRFLGICFADNTVQLVTWLRPLGNLLGFLKKHRMNLTGKNLLVYCYQISSAMKYLYEQRIVHRDLAARNVLVKSVDFVEVTDFGLAKLIDPGNSEVHVKSGKVPVKWLAPECLEKSIYTHSSDVWAFGVTCWEILTYGHSPYQGMDVHSILDYLTIKGQRLAQPSNCSVDLYGVLLRCWVSNPDSRPTFVTLKDDFFRFCRAPHLYVSGAHSVNTVVPQSQNELLQEILEETDTDFQCEDPLDYEDTNGGGSIMSGSRLTRLTSTASTRYRGDPMDLFHDDLPPTPTTPRQEMLLEDSNYLVPNAKLPSPGSGVLYTTVVKDNGETQLLQTKPGDGYYNELVPGGDYYNETQSKRALLTPIEELENSGGGKEVESVL
ncbi:unnamed protein product, partial [Mesorhabditis belari]|uniref:receptor protein-tyrosine kinase n=1 Tax=Mesorhabditis belari TaxID=2138241 RepID=A0AAF3F822_9BILA